MDRNFCARKWFNALSVTSLVHRRGLTVFTQPWGRFMINIGPFSVKVLETTAIVAGAPAELSNSAMTFSHPTLSTSAEKTLKKLTLVLIAFVFCLLAANAFGQGFD